LLLSFNLSIFVKNNTMDISIADIEQHYRIEEDGKVFSLKRQKYLKPIRNTAGHLHVGLGYYQTGKLFLIGSLVALKYLGERPQKSQLSYKDFNIHNLHYTNLEYKTHAQIIQRSRSMGKRVFCA
jgi:hypothetical protein